jgi:hypothetical protein
MLARVEEVVLIRQAGAGFHDVREYAKTKGWGVGESQLYRYLHRLRPWSWPTV